ncbi:cryptochrome/photolyase family protein [Roseovarius sp. SYSU LYC5161]|uniref:cryptochrome/photolyase family protein n=1 Tax=Roseovarius halophilus (ex Wu et al. 2025) TaxID=3376060 RepID=UPI00399A0433
MSDTRPTIVWLRRDLRLVDHPTLAAACAEEGPVIPVFIHDDTVEALGAAPKWRLGLSIAALARRIEEKGSRLILRRGDALQVLRDLVRETGAGAVHWSRLYDPASIARDKAVKAGLRDDGTEACSHAGHVLFEPWTVTTKTGGFYKVYSPMWRAVKDRDVPAPEAAPGRLPAPADWPASDRLDAWQMGRAMNRGTRVCLPYQAVGEDAAQDRLARFTETAIAAYDDDRNLPAQAGTSGLSENLTYGEISPRQCWHAGLRALHDGAAGAEAWLKELAWREFAYHLMYHTPHIARQSWREEWQSFPWHDSEDGADVRAWKQGRTGVPFVDAAMREMYVTGKMHNRARMIVGSYLTKHLLTHWMIGMRWFEDCLTDWDPASNAMGWQWVAGSGPDATPYFRIFNPATQAEKFDPDGTYRRRWIAEGQSGPPDTALAYFEAVPRSWGLAPGAPYPEPVIGLKEGRERALAAYETHKG